MRRRQQREKNAAAEANAEEMLPEIDVLSKEVRRLDRVVKTFLDFSRPVDVHALYIGRPSERQIVGAVNDYVDAVENAARHRAGQIVRSPLVERVGPPG